MKPVGRVRSGDHLGLTFGADEEQREVVATFLVDGLAKGEKVLHVSAATAPELLVGWLRAREVDRRPALARGQLQVRRAARELRGRRLRVVHLAPGLRNVVSLVGWDQTPGLVFSDEAACA